LGEPSTTALNTKDGVSFEKYWDEFKADIKRKYISIKDILKRKD
jgi:hypothetical protein